jgi:D-glutamate N-acetyltransferase
MMMSTPRNIVVLTDGHTDSHTAKTAISVIRYRPQEVVAMLDKQSAGKTCQEVVGTGGAIPVVATLADAPGADTLLIGIAPPGGKIPLPWRPIVLEAIARGMNIVSGLHDLLKDDAEFVAAATKHGVELVDVRDNNERDVANREGVREQCLRIHTIANDCSCGKMIAAIEVVEGLKRRGKDAKFVATGQTGIMVEGDGCPVDRVIADFVSGAAEKLVLANQSHEVMVIEGQGSLFHPRYSCVTLGLLHGTMPDGLIACYEMGRTKVQGMEQVDLPSLERVIEVYEMSAGVMHPCRVIGVAVNGRAFTDEQVEAECEEVTRRTGLPACDVYRHGADKLVEAVLGMKK